MRKRIKKKMESRFFYPKYKDYKREILKPWKDYVREQKHWSKLGGKPITRDEANDLLEMGLYTNEEIRKNFKVIDNGKECSF